MTFDERLPWKEEDLRWKMTFDGRRPSTKTSFNRGRPLMEVSYITWKQCWKLLTLTVTAQMTPSQKSYRLSKPEIVFHMMEEMYAALCMCTCAEKTTVFGKYDSGVGGGIAFIKVYLARAYTTLVLVMLVFVFSVLCVRCPPYATVLWFFKNVWIIYK